MEELDTNQIMTRLEATEKQISLLERCIEEEASKLQEGMDQSLYVARIAGYNSLLCELKEVRDNYRTELGLE